MATVLSLLCPQGRPLKDSVMSAKLVKKLLQQTGELDLIVEETEEKKSSKKRKRPAENDDEAAVPVDKEKLLQFHVQSKIRLDRAINTHGKVEKGSVERLEKERKRQSKLRSKAIQQPGGVGNSRSSSFQKTHQKHEPTFHKKTHQAEKKEKMLRDIAKLLKKTKKPFK